MKTTPFRRLAAPILADPVRARRLKWKARWAKIRYRLAFLSRVRKPTR